MPSLLGHPFRVLIYTTKALALGHLLVTYGYSTGYGWGPSMLPTFLTMNEWFVTDRSHRRGRGVRVGDCVVYSIPVEPGEEGIKRVLGLPGDYVLLNSPGVGADTMIQIPKGHCYIVGDNLPWSRDSRDFGPIPMGLIKGKVVAKVVVNGWWPFNWFTKVESGLQPVLDSPKT
ncbi:LexA/Signal peptidase [Daldinia loculata]|uniref:LexA/Signal peptidase n=1 Tax=Daldinia loculata TaxID=103429 RepID=UPI0020C29E47|nr:LexA/Signal peptidase [Daldinia loculata]KAI1648173.1 LexA/Signal peptidase [Daldinia loculata]KAI2781495.1 LexA/Signal peptidase [Daldinia loculata]